MITRDPRGRRRSHGGRGSLGRGRPRVCQSAALLGGGGEDAEEERRPASVKYSRGWWREVTLFLSGRQLQRASVAKAWGGGWDPPTLPVGCEVVWPRGGHSLQNSPSKGGARSSQRTGGPAPGSVREKRTLCPHKKGHTCVHGGTAHSGLEVVTTRMSIHGGTDK